MGIMGLVDASKIQDSDLKKKPEGVVSSATKSVVTSKKAKSKVPMVKKTTEDKKTPTPPDIQKSSTKRQNITFWCPPPSYVVAREIDDINTLTYLVFDGIKIGTIYADASQGPVQANQEINYTFFFLMPRDIMESLSHEWASYESISSKAAEMYARLGGSWWEQIQGLGDVLKKHGMSKETFKGYMESLQKGTLGKDLFGKVKQIAGELQSTGGGKVPFTRVDTPLTYKSSERRSYEFIFHLFAYEDRYADVVEPVRFLQFLSSPSKYKGDSETTMANTKIEPPYLFKIYSDPGDFLLMKNAIIKQINPVFKGPWVNGLPTYCELRVSVTEYMPLYDDVFDPDRILTYKI